MSIASDREELAKIERQMAELADLGQAYSVVGGHSVTLPRYSELTAMADKLRARILRRKGYHGRVS